MTLNNKHITFLLSVSVFVVFFSFYFATSNILPHGAGPDWRSNTDVTKFIYEHGRLAVLPDDEDELYFTVYGGTRAFRPPLSFIVSAVTAKALSFTDLDPHIQFRKGSALLCALAVALAFYALCIYFNNYGIGILGAAAIGLMPQFTFIASYNNDDSGAIFSATLMIAVLVRIYRYGVSTTNAILIGLAGGLVVLSKMSAWLLAPSVLVFLAIFFQAPIKSLLRYSAIAGLVFMLSGGWWFAFNMYHYGIDDPLQTKIASKILEDHRRLPPDMGVGYAANDIGYYDLVVENYKNFLGETAKATIGNLDWLKLRVGPLQYTFYMAIFYIALAYYLFSIASYTLRRMSALQVDVLDSRKMIFETLLLLMIGFQIFMYIWTNIHNDIQIQGKYIIPIFLSILLLFFSGLERSIKVISTTWLRVTRTGIAVSTTAVRKSLVVAATLLFVVYVHWDAWVNYVIPFYNPPVYKVNPEDYRSIPLTPSLSSNAVNLDIRHRENAVEFVVTGDDPKVNFSKDLCSLVKGATMLRISFYADKADKLQLFIDEGYGFSEEHSYTTRYSQGDNNIFLEVSTENCRRIRFDPAVGSSGTFILKSLQIAPIGIEPG